MGSSGGPGMMPMGGYDKAAAAKMQAMHDPYAQKGAHDMMIAFLHPKSTNGVLMELCEPPKQKD